MTGIPFFLPDDFRRAMGELYAEAGAAWLERLRTWAPARSVLSAWWSFEDHGWEMAMVVAEVLAGLRV
jgi:hypothetical protein